MRSVDSVRCREERSSFGRARLQAGGRPPRAGTIVILFALMLMLLLGVVALAVDYGYLCVVRGQLQRTADAAALAGASALYKVDGSLETSWYCLSPDPVDARLQARQYVRANPAAAKDADVGLNVENAPGGDILLGHLFYPQDLQEPLNLAFDPPNSVRVRVPFTTSHANGSVGLFFAKALGIYDADVEAAATATTWYPALLPFATSAENWDSLALGGVGDNYAYRPGQGSLGVVAGPDGVSEIVMYPGTWDGTEMPPGNFGLIQIGPEGDVMTVVRRQIDMGPSVGDMDVHGGELASGDQVPGRTGIKSSAKTAFLGGWADGRNFGGMLGRARMLPLYEHVSGNGANAVFTLTRFVAVRVMALKIDATWRIDRLDTEGDEITGIVVQPITDANRLIEVHLTR